MATATLLSVPYARPAAVFTVVEVVVAMFTPGAASANAGMHARSPKSPETPVPPFATSRLPLLSKARPAGLSMSGFDSLTEFVIASDAGDAALNESGPPLPPSDTV